MLKRVTTAIVTDGSQNATVFLGNKLRGRLHMIIYRPGTLVNGQASAAPLDTGADLTITAEQVPPGTAAQSAAAANTIPAGTPILTKSNLGTVDSFLYPRALPTNANSLTGPLGTIPSEYIPLVEERIKVVVAQGGATKSGSIEAIYEVDEPVG